MVDVEKKTNSPILFRPGILSKKNLSNWRSAEREAMKKDSSMIPVPVHKSTREHSPSPPSMIVGKKKPPSSTPIASSSDDEPHVHFSTVARVKLIPCDQLPPRPVHMERSKSNPKRRLWVLHRLCQIGGRYYPNLRNRDEYVVLDPGTPWPSRWGKPPPPIVLEPMKEPVENESVSDDSSLSIRK